MGSALRQSDLDNERNKNRWMEGRSDRQIDIDRITKRGKKRRG
jgi:hypothetical protein